MSTTTDALEPDAMAEAKEQLYRDGERLDRDIQNRDR